MRGNPNHSQYSKYSGYGQSPNTAPGHGYNSQFQRGNGHLGSSMGYPNDLLLKSGRNALRHQSGIIQDPRSGLHQGVQGYHQTQTLLQQGYHAHNAMGSPSSGPARETGPVFDMNDFPALGASSDKGARAPNPNRDRIQSHQPVPHIQSEGDFPSLGSSGSTAKTNGQYSQRGTPTTTQPQGGEAAAPPARLSKQGHSEKDAAQLKKPKPKGPCMSHSDLFALKGLLQVIRMTDPDLNTLALGMDLTSLAGLNLNSTEVLYPTFASPWADAPMPREPTYDLPYCYYMQPPALKTSHLSKFRLETLFYIFYNMPRDTLQVYAAKELYSREWRFHKDLKVWVTQTRDAKTRTMQAQLQFFDIHNWERRLFKDHWPKRDISKEKDFLMSAEAINNL